MKPRRILGWRRGRFFFSNTPCPTTSPRDPVFDGAGGLPWLLRLRRAPTHPHLLCAGFGRPCGWWLRLLSPQCVLGLPPDRLRCSPAACRGGRARPPCCGSPSTPPPCSSFGAASLGGDHGGIWLCPATAAFCCVIVGRLVAREFSITTHHLQQGRLQPDGHGHAPPPASMAGRRGYGSGSPLDRCCLGISAPPACWCPWLAVHLALLQLQRAPGATSPSSFLGLPASLLL